MTIPEGFRWTRTHGLYKIATREIDSNGIETRSIRRGSETTQVRG
jgi:hypothetical protein